MNGKRREAAMKMASLSIYKGILNRTVPQALYRLLWAGDEEFPPSAQLLYTGNFAQGFAPEDRVVAGDILISHIKSAM